LRLQVAERSTIGKRQNNEDSVVSAHLGIDGNDLVLLGVFDGVGAADGETASRIAADTFLSLAPLVARNLAAGPTTNPEGDQKEITKSLAGIWQRKASNRLRSEQASATNPNMATTCVAAAMSGDVLIGWWLGDSRAYLFRDGRLQQLTRDHSTVAELGLSDEEAFDHPKRSEITRFLRASATFEPEIFVEEWRDGDVMLLVSDGVSGSLRGWELETFLAYWLISDISADMLAARLLEHIVPNQSDNASVAVAIRGTPRPLGSAFPQVPLPALLGLGLTENVLSALVTIRQTALSGLSGTRLLGATYLSRLRS
jgi:serine/threonine protein phosphatase PrpC